MLIAQGFEVKKRGVEMRYKKTLNSFLKLPRFKRLFLLTHRHPILSESPSRSSGDWRRAAQYIGIHIF
jgi:hypothetical protein